MTERESQETQIDKSVFDVFANIIIDEKMNFLPTMETAVLNHRKNLDATVVIPAKKLDESVKREELSIDKTLPDKITEFNQAAIREEKI